MHGHKVLCLALVCIHAADESEASRVGTLLLYTQMQSVCGQSNQKMRQGLLIGQRKRN